MLALSGAVQASLLPTGSVFDDEFTTLNTTTWPNPSNASVSGGFLTLSDTTIEQYAAVNSADNILSGLGTSTNWAAEIRFAVTGAMSAPANQSFLLLTGISGTTWTATGVDLRLLQDSTGVNGSTYSLGWLGWDGSNGSRVATVITTLTKGTTYVVDAVRKSNGTVDIYLNDALIANKAAIGTANPTKLYIGDEASGAIYANDVKIDYVRVGIVPEPSIMAMLVTAVLGLIAYAWRKRR